MGLITTKPTYHTSEVTLIGTGGGYGESCVIHLGNNEWIVIDSCVNPHTKECLPLKYLKSLNLEIEHCVKLIICTHWHDDHIQGMSQLFRECKSAKFCFASCTDKEKFSFFLKMDYEKANDSKWSSSTYEFNKCLEVLVNRDGVAARAIQDRLVYNSISDTIKCDVITLSPSDFTLNQFDHEISDLIGIVGQRNKKLINKSPNFKSVVTLIKINNHRILLGADLEISLNPKEGWTNIIENSISIDLKSSLYKVPHHGSINGYSVDIWNQLLTVNPTAILTPWNRGRILPKIEMLKQMSSHSTSLYITANMQTMGTKPKKRERRLEKAIAESNSTLKEIRFKEGIIQCRLDILQEESVWQVETSGEAIHVNKVFTI